jgi:hypothetical protein
MAAPTRASGSRSTGGSATSQPCVVPTGSALNSIMVSSMYIEATSLRTITAPSGWAECPASPISVVVSGANYFHHQFWKRLTATDTGSYTFSYSGTAV